MTISFSEAVRQVEAEQILEACRAMRLDDDATGFLLAKHRRSGYLLG